MSDDNEPIQVSIKKQEDKVVTKTGIDGGILIYCCLKIGRKDFWGYSVCHPKDIFNFGFGAELALERAIKKTPTSHCYDKAHHGYDGAYPRYDGMIRNTSPSYTYKRVKLLPSNDRKKIWDKFNKLYPPEKRKCVSYKNIRDVDFADLWEWDYGLPTE